MSKRYTFLSCSPRVLMREIRQKTQRRLRIASIGISGNFLTGRRTLAGRFGAMDQGPFEEAVESRYHYMAKIDLDTRPTNGTGEVHIRTYIMPTPEDLPEQDPPRFYEQLEFLTSIILLADVTDRETLTDVIESMHNFQSDYYEGYKHSIMVGNKVDLNRDIFPDHFTSEDGLKMTQNNLRFSNYVECSAKQNINVDVILEEILVQIIAKDP